MVSTICRRCRSHIEIRDGNVVGPQKAAQGPSIGLPSDQRPPPDARPAASAPPATLRIRTGHVEEHPAPQVPAALPPTLRIRSKTSEETPEPPPRHKLPSTLRIRTQPTEDIPEAPRPEPLPMPPGLRIRGPLSEPPAEPPQTTAGSNPPAAIARPRQRGLLEKLLRPVPPPREVLCIECGRRFQAPAAADTTDCPTCGCHLSLRDFVIAEPSTTRIQTRGNVTILRKGKLGGQPVECHDLAVHGTLETGATCSGDLVISSPGLFRGKLCCERLLIEKRVRVEFIHPIETGEAIINGQVTGSIRARRTVTLLKRSRLRGNIAATSLILKQGAAHTGVLRIIAVADEPAANREGQDVGSE